MSTRHTTGERPGARTAFLLAQLGSLASSRFAERTKALGLTPSDAGILRYVGRTPGLSQRALADRLGSAPSRVVALVDSLEQRGLLRRERSASDRRNYELRLTDAGQELLEQLRTVAREHESEMLAGLTPEQAEQLHGLLALVAADRGLDAELHRETARNRPLRA